MKINTIFINQTMDNFMFRNFCYYCNEKQIKYDFYPVSWTFKAIYASPEDRPEHSNTTLLSQNCKYRGKNICSHISTTVFTNTLNYLYSGELRQSGEGKIVDASKQN